MLLPVMPTAVARGATIGLFTIASAMIAMHTLLLGVAAQRTTLGARTKIAVPAVAGAFLAAWFAVAVAVADQTNFPFSNPASALPLAPAITLIPLAIAVTALLSVAPMRAINDATPATWLIRLQVYRLVGFIFLVFLSYGVVPASFAVPAAVGDMLTGALALPVAALVDRRGPAAYKWARAWNALGILDLIVAPVSAVLSGSHVITQFPLGMIALFMGPPLGILTHLYSLRNLAATAKRAKPARSAAIGTMRHA